MILSRVVEAPARSATAANGGWVAASLTSAAVAGAAVAGWAVSAVSAV